MVTQGILKFFVVLFVCFVMGLAEQCRAHAAPVIVKSPDNKISIEVIIENGNVKYQAKYMGESVIRPSLLGFQFKHQPALMSNLSLISEQQKLVDEPWEKVWGQSKSVENRYRELTVKFQENNHLKRQLVLIFRVFNDGFGFRYEFPKQPNLANFAITSEETEFVLANDHTVWWIPANFDSYEEQYRETKLSQVTAVNTPVTFKTDNELYLSIHEAALTDYAGMTLSKKKGTSYHLTASLVPWPDGIKVKGKTPFKTPWRTVQIAKTAGDLIESDLIVNLNEPNVLQDTSWIKPMKYIGIWWGMHMRKYTWEAGPKHGATTKNAKEYIDFANQHGIGGVLVEGWNQGWETWHTGLNIQDFTKAYDDFDLREVTRYGESKGVYLIGHHETGGNIPMYEAQMEAAFKLYHDVGVKAIKTGYAGKMHPEGIYHHGQQMVNHYRRVLELAAKYKIMVNAHEPIKPTGIRRTYPNMMTREGARGMEWNGWSEGNSPEHTVTLPFTRLLAGPLDYTPGIFNIKFDRQGQYRVHTTLAKQLAMFVALYSPMQMAADMIENYIDQPAFEFIEKVPTTWDETKVLSGDIADFINIARRSNENWFIGGMTDEVPRTMDLKLDFLTEGTTYIAHSYSDAFATDFKDNPTAIAIEQFIIQKGDTIKVSMASGGGYALYISPRKGIEKALDTRLKHFNEMSVQKETKFEQGTRFGEIEQVQHLAVNKKIIHFTQYDEGYSGGGNSALIDGIKGGSDYKTLWQGYRKKDIDVVIDLGDIMPISSIEIGFLQSLLHSILLPSQVNFALSINGQDFRQVEQQSYQTVEGIDDYQQKRFKATFSTEKARYIRVRAKNLSELPKWHIRPGQETFIFADEIIVH